MEELNILYKELQERKEHLESRYKTKITEGRIAENLVTMVRVQQLIMPVIVKSFVCPNGCGQNGDAGSCIECVGK